MKKNINFLVLVFVLLVTSCGRKVDYPFESFVTLDAKKYSAAEDAGVLRIPVNVYNPSGKEMNVIVKAVDSTAIAGKDYNIVYPVQGVMNFSGDETTKYIEVEIIPHLGVFTKNLNFSIELSAADEQTTVGNVNVTTCTISDDDHPLKYFLGDWSGTANNYMNDETFPMEITISENSSDDTYKTMKIENLEPVIAMYGSTAAVLAEINDEKTQLTIKSGQYAGSHSAYGSCSIYGLTASSSGQFGLEDAIVMNLSEDKKSLTISTMFGSLLTSGDYAGYLFYIYEPDLVLTRK